MNKEKSVTLKGRTLLNLFTEHRSLTNTENLATVYENELKTSRKDFNK